MATRSAAKAHRQSIKRRLRNRAAKSATKTAMKAASEAIVSGDPNVAREAVRNAIRALDQAAQKGVVHANSASRRKSRLLLKFNAAVAAMQTPGEEPPVRKKTAPKVRAKGSAKKPSSRATTKKAKK